MLHILLQALAVTGGQTAEQLVGDDQQGREQGAALALAQQRQGQHVGPGVVEQCTQRPTGGGAGQAVRQQLAGAAAGALQSLAPAHGLDVTALGDPRLVTPLHQVVLQVVVHLQAQRRIRQFIGQALQRPL